MYQKWFANSCKELSYYLFSYCSLITYIFGSVYKVIPCIKYISTSHVFMSCFVSWTRFGEIGLSKSLSKFIVLNPSKVDFNLSLFLNQKEQELV